MSDDSDILCTRSKFKENETNEIFIQFARLQLKCFVKKHVVKLVQVRHINVTSSVSMPKKKNKNIVEAAASKVEKSEPVTVGKSGIEIQILAKPGAKCNSITDIKDVVSVQIAAPPVDGEANSELVKYLAKVLDLKKSQVTLEKGFKSRSKTILVPGNNSDEIIKKLEGEKAKR